MQVIAGNYAPDECHLIAHQAGKANVVAKIKQGLKDDSPGDLVPAIRQTDGTSKIPVLRKIERRDKFRQSRMVTGDLMQNGDRASKRYSVTS
jgi:hypothetical protein